MDSKVQIGKILKRFSRSVLFKSDKIVQQNYVKPLFKSIQIGFFQFRKKYFKRYKAKNLMATYFAVFTAL